MCIDYLYSKLPAYIILRPFGTLKEREIKNISRQFNYKFLLYKNYILF
jgi:hypothetical protein